MMTVISIRRVGSLAEPFVYLINPGWMAWSKIGLPDWVRWLGVGIGILCDVGIYWLFSSIGSGITPTSRYTKGTPTRHQRTLSLDASSALYDWLIHVLVFRDDG